MDTADTNGKAQVETGSRFPDWTAPFFSKLGLKQGAGPGAVYAITNDVAEKLAPDTRRVWRWIMTLQGVAVLAPLLWLLVVRGAVPVLIAAVATVIATLLVIGICWWLRWRGLQLGWAQARIVAEIARSDMATRKIAGHATEQALSGAPPLMAIAEWLGGDEETPSPNARERYITERIDDQASYFARKLDESLSIRKKLSRYVTLSLDAALFLAVGGLVLSFHPSAERWLRLSGSDFVLGCVGAALPLTAILMQTLGHYLEVNRRIARYSQQIDFLQAGKVRLQASQTAAEIEGVVADVERGLLGEVIDWFYQTSHVQPYYRSKAQNISAVPLAALKTRHGWLARMGIWFGRSAAFFGRVVFGRVLVAALSILFTTALIAFYTPKDPVETSRLRREDGRLLSSAAADSWTPIEARLEKGFVLVAHGLHDSVRKEPLKDGSIHWMTRLKAGLENRFGRNCPEICLVDWRFAAVPARASALGYEVAGDPEGISNALPSTAQGWVQDVAAIRPQAEEIGDLVGYKLARLVRTGKIRKDRPMHFIGHSAGGFLVTHAAVTLRELGLLSENSRVTLLDTPVPDADMLAKLLTGENPCKVDYYTSSLFAQNVPADHSWPDYRRFDLKPDEAGSKNQLARHSYAHRWYVSTITDPVAGAVDGFSLSPLIMWEKEKP